MFGVIICPRCHRARGVSLSTKRAKCSHCGHSIDVGLAKVYHKTESQEELVLAVQKMTDRLATGIEDYPAEKKRRSQPVRAHKRRATWASEEELLQLVRLLTEDGDSFAIEDLMAKEDLDKDRAELLIQRMLDEGMIFEPTPGHFRRSSS